MPLAHTTTTYIMGSGFPSSCPQGQVTPPENTKELRSHGGTLIDSRITGRRHWINSSPFLLPTDYYQIQYFFFIIFLKID